MTCTRSLWRSVVVIFIQMSFAPNLEEMIVFQALMFPAAFIYAFIVRMINYNESVTYLGFVNCMRINSFCFLDTSSLQDDRYCKQTMLFFLHTVNNLFLLILQKEQYIELKIRYKKISPTLIEN